MEKRRSFIRFAQLVSSVVLASSLAPDPLAAQDAQLVDQPFVEEFGETLSKVSGDVVMGVMLGQQSSQRRTADLIAPMPDIEGAAEILTCVRIVSRDGRYEAENTYRVTGSGGVPFGYEGEYLDELTARPAVALVATGRCGDRPTGILPARWSDADGAIDALRVFINSAGNPVAAVIGNGRDFDEPCTDVTDEAALKYTSVCTIPLDKLSGREAALSFFISRSFTEERFDLTVMLPNLDE